MKISLNTMKQLIGHELPDVNELVSIINQQLGTVESITYLGAKYKDAKIVKIATCEKHPNADRLSVCTVDAGLDELVQVVCGAPNVRAGMWAIWLPPESIVPSTFNDAEPFKLGARELRGVMSNGMLAAGDELAINSDHDGIVEISENDIPAGMQLTAGASFAELYELNDTIIDIENKMFTHRPDLFGQMGVAREIFAIIQPEPSSQTHENVRFKEQELYWRLPEFAASSRLTLTTFNKTPEGVPRVLFTVMDNVTVAPSPLWLQTTLVRWGSKAINNVVDITNYIMLLTAQPTHAYDYDTLSGGTIGARMAHDGETVTLLNGKTYSLTSSDIVIADAEKTLALGGIMGGSSSEVSESTKRIVLEVATFDMYATRKSSMRHGLFTDALTRFTKGQSPLQNDRIMQQLISLMESIGAKQASNVYDHADGVTAADNTTIRGAMRVRSGFINDRLGLTLTPEHIGNLLRFVNFASYKPDDGEDDELEITAPFWRTDIVDPEDIIEEVGRLHGFDKLPHELPKRSAKAAPINEMLRTKHSVRSLLTRAGANELLTYSFIHERLLERTGQNKSLAYKLSNALSPDLQYYRLSLTPSLLDKVHMNVKAGYDSFALYEIGRSHIKQDDKDVTQVPIGNERVALVIAQSDKSAPKGAAYYLAQRYLRQLLPENTHRLIPITEYSEHSTESVRQLLAPYDSERSAYVLYNDSIIGVVGEYRSEVHEAFKLPAHTAGFEIDLSVMTNTSIEYKPLSKFPSVSQDISIRTTGVPFATIARVVDETVSEKQNLLDVSIKPTAIYRPENSSDTTTTFRLVVTSKDSTLRDADVKPLIESISKAVADTFNGHVV